MGTATLHLSDRASLKFRSALFNFHRSLPNLKRALPKLRSALREFERALSDFDRSLGKFKRALWAAAFSLQKIAARLSVLVISILLDAIKKRKDLRGAG